jgi:hypothetical protein
MYLLHVGSHGCVNIPIWFLSTQKAFTLKVLTRHTSEGCVVAGGVVLTVVVVEIVVVAEVVEVVVVVVVVEVVVVVVVSSVVAVVSSVVVVVSSVVVVGSKPQSTAFSLQGQSATTVAFGPQILATLPHTSSMGHDIISPKLGIPGN